MKIIVLNQSNLIPDGQNNKMIYKFPNSITFKDNYIAVSSVSMYYSWFNITTTLRNNTWTYTWVVGTTPQTYDIVVPDGLYEIADLNSYAQFIMTQNGTYLIDSTGNNVFYFTLTSNTNRYAVQLSTYLLPTSLPTGFTLPTNFVGFPTTAQNCVVSFPANFNGIVGFSAGFTSDVNLNDSYVVPSNQTLISKNSLGTITYLSTQSPEVQPNSNAIISISGIDNNLIQPSSVIYSLVPNVGFGQLISEQPPQFMWNKLIDGTYNQLRLSILGTNLQPLQIQDPNITILLAVRGGDEYGGK
jgi:hypothetical protein